MIVDSHYTQLDWARGTIETLTKIREKKEIMVALVDLRLEIDIMSKFYKKGRWNI